MFPWIDDTIWQYREVLRSHLKSKSNLLSVHNKYIFYMFLFISSTFFFPGFSNTANTKKYNKFPNTINIYPLLQQPSINKGTINHLVADDIRITIKVNQKWYVNFLSDTDFGGILMTFVDFDFRDYWAGNLYYSRKCASNLWKSVIFWHNIFSPTRTLWITSVYFSGIGALRWMSFSCHFNRIQET